MDIDRRGLNGLRRGGRAVEGGGLLNRYTGITRIEGSNPFLSAIIPTKSERPTVRRGRRWGKLRGNLPTEGAFCAESAGRAIYAHDDYARLPRVAPPQQSEEFAKFLSSLA